MRDSLYWTYVMASVAAVMASLLALVMLVLWVRGRRQGQPAGAVGVTLAISFVVVGLSVGWLAYHRHEKCKPTVSRTLCEPPLDWFRDH